MSYFILSLAYLTLSMFSFCFSILVPKTFYFDPIINFSYLKMFALYYLQYRSIANIKKMFKKKDENNFSLLIFLLKNVSFKQISAKILYISNRVFKNINVQTTYKTLYRIIKNRTNKYRPVCSLGNFVRNRKFSLFLTQG